LGKPWENHRKMGISWGLTLTGGDWNHGMDYDFPETVGNN
jgi:hypothetical protein